MANHGKPWKIMENYEKSWKSQNFMENHRTSWKIIDNYGKSWK